VNVCLDMVLLCRSVAEPQCDLGAQASLSRMRSPDPKVFVESLTDDTRTTTPPLGAAEKRATSPPVVNSRVAILPHAGDAGVVLLGTSGRRLPGELLMWTPSAQFLLGLMMTWSRT
jgi:hypothetical protein